MLAPLLLCAAHAYAVVVGVNEPPPGSLKPLRYADDDAARYAAYFSRMTREVHLLTAADTDTIRRYAPRIAGAPTWTELRRVLKRVAAQVSADERAGEESTLYFVYSGHGARNAQGAVTLTLLGGDI